MLIADPDYKFINKLKRELSKSFHMKNIEFTKQILGMKISCDIKNDRLWLSQESHIKKVLDMFNMGKVKLVSSLHFEVKLSSKYYPTSKRRDAKCALCNSCG